jgi:glycosyltransferase involved in cell wall biosynthesis
LKPSLSVVLPLHNAQSSLVGLVDELLDVLPELTSNFEVVLVDDGSTDATIEVAHEISLNFPQVRLIVHPAKLGACESLRSAMRYSHGELLLACGGDESLDPHEIVKLWNRRTADGAVFGLRGSHGPVGTIPPVPARRSGGYGAGDPPPMPEMLLVPRRLLIGWSQIDDRAGVMTFLRGKGYPLRGIEIRPRRTKAKPRPAAKAAERRRTDDGVPTTNTRVEAAGPVADSKSQKRPNYLLAKIKAFTLGE